MLKHPLCLIPTELHPGGRASWLLSEWWGKKAWHLTHREHVKLGRLTRGLSYRKLLSIYEQTYSSAGCPSSSTSTGVSCAASAAWLPTAAHAPPRLPLPPYQVWGAWYPSGHWRWYHGTLGRLSVVQEGGEKPQPLDSPDLTVATAALTDLAVGLPWDLPSLTEDDLMFGSASLVVLAMADNLDVTRCEPLAVAAMHEREH